jgi:hypothetical protein
MLVMTMVGGGGENPPNAGDGFSKPSSKENNPMAFNPGMQVKTTRNLLIQKRQERALH